MYPVEVLPSAVVDATTVTRVPSERTLRMEPRECSVNIAWLLRSDVTTPGTPMSAIFADTKSDASPPAYCPATRSEFPPPCAFNPTIIRELISTISSVPDGARYKLEMFPSTVASDDAPRPLTGTEDTAPAEPEMREITSSCRFSLCTV